MKHAVTHEVPQLPRHHHNLKKKPLSAPNLRLLSAMIHTRLLPHKGIKRTSSWTDTVNTHRRAVVPDRTHGRALADSEGEWCLAHTSTSNRRSWTRTHTHPSTHPIHKSYRNKRCSAGLCFMSHTVNSPFAPPATTICGSSAGIPMLSTAPTCTSWLTSMLGLSSAVLHTLTCTPHQSVNETQSAADS